MRKEIPTRRASPKRACATGLDGAGAGSNLLDEDLMLPSAVVKKSSVINNAEWMREYVEKSGVLIAPHGKTTMSPQMFKIQMDHGAWGMTLANALQVRTARHAGVDRILLANQLVGKQAIAYVLNELKEHPKFEFYCLVDNADNIKELANAVEEIGLGRPLSLLIEIGPMGGRTGVRHPSEAIALAKLIRSLPGSLRLCGVECYEGVVRGDKAEKKVEDFLLSVASVALELWNNKAFVTERVILTAGGTAYFDLVVKVFKRVQFPFPFEIVIRPGCYISHDAGIYEAYQQALVARDETARSIGKNLVPSIEILSYVQSTPELGVAILNMGKRDVSFDSGLPRPKMIYRPKSKTAIAVGKQCEIYNLNDQHAYLSYDEGQDIEVGDIVVADISHPCLTFDKWRRIPLVDDEYTVVDFLEIDF